MRGLLARPSSSEHVHLAEGQGWVSPHFTSLCLLQSAYFFSFPHTSKGCSPLPEDRCSGDWPLQSCTLSSPFLLIPGSAHQVAKVGYLYFS